MFCRENLATIRVACSGLNTLNGVCVCAKLRLISRWGGRNKKNEAVERTHWPFSMDHVRTGRVQNHIVFFAGSFSELAKHVPFSL